MTESHYSRSYCDFCNEINVRQSENLQTLKPYAFILFSSGLRHDDYIWLCGLTDCKVNGSKLHSFTFGFRIVIVQVLYWSIWKLNRDHIKTSTLNGCKPIQRPKEIMIHLLLTLETFVQSYGCYMWKEISVITVWWNPQLTELCRHRFQPTWWLSNVLHCLSKYLLNPT